MTTVLHINASGTRSGSVSRAATQKMLGEMAADRIITRDLAETALPQIDEAWIKTRLVAQDALSAADRDVLSLSNALIAEVQAADVILIGMPMYNFGMPASLKLWVDLIARPKVTFAYTADGPVGLLEGKRAVVAVASGGVPVGSAADFATPHLEQILRFVGIDDIQVHVAKDIVAQAAA